MSHRSWADCGFVASGSDGAIGEPLAAMAFARRAHRTTLVRVTKRRPARASGSAGVKRGYPRSSDALTAPRGRDARDTEQGAPSGSKRVATARGGWDRRGRQARGPIVVGRPGRPLLRRFDKTADRQPGGRHGPTGHVDRTVCHVGSGRSESPPPANPARRPPLLGAGRAARPARPVSPSGGFGGSPSPADGSRTSAGRPPAWPG